LIPYIIDGSHISVHAQLKLFVTGYRLPSIKDGPARPQLKQKLLNCKEQALSRRGAKYCIPAKANVNTSFPYYRRLASFGAANYRGVWIAVNSFISGLSEAGR